MWAPAQLVEGLSQTPVVKPRTYTVIVVCLFTNQLFTAMLPVIFSAGVL